MYMLWVGHVYIYHLFRFCCDDWSDSDVKLNSKTQEMMVLFRANTSSLPSDRRGFTAKVYLCK